MGNTKQNLSCYSNYPEYVDYLNLQKIVNNVGNAFRFSQSNQSLYVGQRVATMPYGTSTPVDISLDIDTSLATRDIMSGEVMGKLETVQTNNYGQTGISIYIDFIAGNNLIVSTESCNISAPSTVDFGILKTSNITSGSDEARKTIQVNVVCSSFNEKTLLDFKVKNPASKYDSSAYETNHTGLGLKIYTSNEAIDRDIMYPNKTHEISLNTAGSANFPLTFKFEAYSEFSYGSLSLPIIMSFTLQ